MTSGQQVLSNGHRNKSGMSSLRKRKGLVLGSYWVHFPRTNIEIDRPPLVKEAHLTDHPFVQPGCPLVVQRKIFPQTKDGAVKSEWSFFLSFSIIWVCEVRATLMYCDEALCANEKAKFPHFKAPMASTSVAMASP